MRNSILPHIKFDKSNSKLIQWFSIQKRHTNLKESIHCGVVYITPVGSKYASEDPYLEIQNEIQQYCGSSDVSLNLNSSSSENVFVFGDFNSSTGTLCDYVIPDEFVSEMHGNDILLDENMHTMHCLNKSNTPPPLLEILRVDN